METKQVQWTDDSPILTDLNKLHPKTRQKMREQLISKRELVLHQMGKQTRGGLSSVMLVVSGIQVVQG